VRPLPALRVYPATGDLVATFCLIHGAWHDGACWDDVVARLRARGHEAVAPDLPLDDPETGYTERAAPALAALARLPGPVVAVGHSMGSGYAPLVAAARPGSLLVHLCPRLHPFEPAAGAPACYRPTFRGPPERPDGTTAWDPAEAVRVMYPRLAPADARRLAERLRPMALPRGPFPLRGPPDVPTALVYAAADEVFEPAWERFMAREVLHVDALEIPGGHFPMAEDPAALTALLERLAADRLGRSPGGTGSASVDPTRPGGSGAR
jgi:dienelactone hydrolase